MVSQTYMDTISTISFWTLTICRFTGWWVTMDVTISFFCMKREQFDFHNFCCSRSEVFNNGWKRQAFWMRQFLLHEQVFEYNLLFCRRSIFRDENNCGDNRLFFDKKKQWWPTLGCQITRASHAYHRAQQFRCGTIVPRCTMSRTTSWTRGLSCHQTANNRGQVFSQRTRCSGLRLSQPRSSMAWHKMECHNSSTVASANKADGINWSFCPVWKRLCVSQPITCLRNI